MARSSTAKDGSLTGTTIGNCSKVNITTESYSILRGTIETGSTTGTIIENGLMA